MKYINVVIDNKSDNTDVTYTYSCEDDEVRIGSKVHVPFAKAKNLKIGYVVSEATEEQVSKYKSKLRSVDHIDELVSLSEESVRTALWMREKYLCRFIDAIRCFLPAGSEAKRRTPKNPVADEEVISAAPVELTDEQAKALSSITASISAGIHDRFLLHGVTGSGKTEVYIRAAQETVNQGRNVIMLVPEISLTAQTIARFINRFGVDEVAVLHSKLTLGERFDQWQRIRRGEVNIVIGARSAVFAPLENIGLIIIDEEHETTYKSDSTPKYDTIEVALKRAQDKDNNGVLILGSATPSAVSYYRGRQGIYKILEMAERYNKVQLPDVEIVDMRDELKSGNVNIISNALYRQMRKQLEEGRQIMLFLNRRGYSTFISCRECGHVLTCPTCGLSLTYHRSTGKASCHYCGYEEDAPKVCPNPECGSRYIKYFGTGTEKVEEAVVELFPEYVTQRVDLDSVKKKGELNKTLKAFEKGKINILIGTQLIAKGLDFKNVGLVGIVSADVSLNIPDFRSPERTFQLITQAAGRAGRGDQVGKVIIQTYNPEHYAVDMAAKQDYKGFYEMENTYRNFMTYPPYSDMFQILFTADNPEAAEAGARHWHGELLRIMPEEDAANVFEPQEAYMSKIRNTYRYSLIIKCPQGQRNRYAEYMWSIKDEERKTKKDYIAVVDINPYSFA